MNSTEVWKDIEGFEGLYQVSNMGRVRSLDRKDAQGHRIKGTVLAGSLNGKGYLRVGLCRDGDVEYKSIHRLAAKAFLDNPDNLPQVNHKDENKTNNAVSNLEWCTALYNNTYGAHSKRIAKALERPIYVVTSSGHRYFFDSTKKAVELLELKNGAVSRCLHGKLKHHGSFSFERAVKPCQA
ncbi:NUMOD4 domain-containing protein [Lacticaseibacillus paracasei]|uniref:NUMOD4 domain-containing protein n=1 Tax=Lacticaseibacillus paracasei TaxID=1597 RepID=UPI000E09D727|nr:NUMOD4 domain-containing protein [Lacticaseibacillus paracasei]RDF86038.1 endonuclease [Lacticaseibacillus paracasei]RNE28542.1 NUMOD4 motif [Lacticaseibacillus paracasei]TEA87843.1 endonuclease [Lacticaseibacillus paracasei]